MECPVCGQAIQPEFDREELRLRVAEHSMPAAFEVAT